MKIRRILSMLICACLLAAAAIIPAQAKSCGCGEVVQIYMDGFGSTLYYNYGTPEQEEAGMSRTDNLAGGIWDVVEGAGRSVLQWSWAPFAGGAGSLVKSIVGHLAMDAQGRSIEPITNHWRLDPAQDHRENPEYYFNYDFRIDPYEAAAQLNEFIEAVCKQTGHGKLAVTGSSEGAIVCMTYLKVYGSKRLDTLILVNGAWQGLTLVGELFTGKAGVSGAAVANYISNNDDGSGRLKLAMALLRGSRLLDFLEPLGDGLIDRVGDQLYAEALIPLFGTMPILWAFVPQAYYPEARKLIAGDPQYKKLLARADKYHNEVQSQAGRLLKNAMSQGVKVAVIASYGLYPMPVTKNSAYQSDGFLDSAYEAGGATAAPIGGTLPLSNVNLKYRSPDGLFDAYTCLFPDQTWFVKNSGHDSGPSRALRQWIIHSKRQPTVWSGGEWPQYLINVEGEARAYGGD
jgi:pimeloyl-ACP methyl ester carboxylesterase